MKNQKKIIYVLLLTFLIYFLSSYVYNKYVLKNEYVKIYYLLSDVKRGQKLDILDSDVIQTIYINKQKNSNISDKYITGDKNDKLNYVFKYDCYSGQILSEDILINQDTYLESSNDSEIIAINLENLSDAVAYKVQKGSIVNIYYTGKSKQTENILDTTKSSVISSNLNDGYISTLLLSNVKIISVLDKDGNDIDINKKDISQTRIIASILIQTDKSNFLIINNLKKYGSFSLSIIS